MKLPEQDKVLTAIVGSYPKPAYLFPDTGRELLDSFGYDFDLRRQELGDELFKEYLDEAASEAISDQNEAGIDLITDGEERRGHYVLHIANKLKGIDPINRKQRSIRGGTDTQNAPRIIGKIEYNGPILLDEFNFLKSRAQGIAKIGLPGPSTLADCVADEFYGNKKDLAYDYAAAIRNEVKSLIDAGCRVIQFDDPVLLRYPNEAQKWGLDTLEACFKGFEDKATFIVHICCGYPNKPLEAKGISYKADSNYYKDVLSWLSGSMLDVVSIEGAQSNLDLSVLPAIGKKSVMLGVLDVGDEVIETVDSLVARGREALKYLPPDQLILAPDCGMVEISRQAASGKLQNLAQTAKILND
jgi:5-methyltetrahydropteroyltriglutamate--homocysteine methyltransferase